MKTVFVFCKPCRGSGKCFEGRCPDCDGKGLTEKRQDGLSKEFFSYNEKLDEQLEFIDRAMRARNLDPRAKAVRIGLFPEPVLSEFVEEGELVWAGVPSVVGEGRVIKGITPTITIVDALGEMGMDAESEEFELGEKPKRYKALSTNVKRRICFE